MRKCWYLHLTRNESPQWREGIFHQWGQDYHNRLGKPVHFPIGIVEDQVFNDIRSIPANRIVFSKKPPFWVTPRETYHND